MNSADPINTVGSVLTRRFKDVGDIVRVDRGIWGLKEWYPNRTFRATKQIAAEIDIEVDLGIDKPAVAAMDRQTSEPEPPSEQSGADLLE
jgi:hypothetical protein